ncbi:DUF2800 domain-containing protein [Chitinophaga sp. CC14]|uniref:DUF2800 domain-containing protein n=1 Tax=Chitinophaga sp. CC14 TaxID=3029199 RepID=UPI003B7ED543
MAHATLSPSSAERWLNCTPSARQEKNFPDKTSEAALEGTLAHSLGELLLRKKLNIIGALDEIKALETIQSNRLYTNAMMEHADDYATFVMEKYSEALAVNSDAQIFLEQRIDLTEHVPEGFGTGDAFIISDGTMRFIDLKYGKGHFVEAKENKQMMLYALGGLAHFDYLFEITQVEMTIYQPRLENFSSWEISVAELKAWGAETLIPRAKLAFAGEGEYVPGKHCTFCKAKGMCRAFAEQNMQMAKHEFKPAPMLTPEEVADILSKADVFEKWLKAVEDHALYSAVHNGAKWPGYKLVEGRSNRKYSDEEKITEVLKQNGFGEDVIFKPQTLIGITDMESKIGKKTFATLLNEFIIKPTGAPALVPESDKRPALNSAEAAVADFTGIEI